VRWEMRTRLVFTHYGNSSGRRAHTAHATEKEAVG
jgi:hypothetical protein